MNNVINMLKMISNPKQYAMNYIKNNNNPIINNMIQQAEKGNTKEVENIARNLLKNQGVDLDKDILPFIK